MDGTCCNTAGDEPTEVLDEYFKWLQFILIKTNIIQKSKWRSRWFVAEPTLVHCAKSFFACQKTFLKHQQSYLYATQLKRCNDETYVV